MSDVHQFSHLGLCVSDLARSRRFYCEGLGFAEALRLEFAGEPSATLLGLPGVRFVALYLRRDGLLLELLHYDAPGAIGDVAARPMNARGLTHLSMRVASADAVAARLVELGGRVLGQTRIANPDLGASAVFVLDPDGTRIELFESTRPLA
jgi:catechol 2,3-dioxygenase-like lactoylglutathione lyase family enzyme